MKNLVLIFLFFGAFLVISTPLLLATPPVMAARIEGQIFDESRRPLADVYVELQNDVYSTLLTKKTDGTGRFTFIGLSVGRFRVRAFPVGKNLLEEVQDVEIIAGLTGTTNDIIFLEFTLRPDKRFVNPIVEKAPEAVFVQDIPVEAKKAYTFGVSSLDKKDTSGLADLEKAIAMFPTYFDALSRLGKEYLIRANYEKAYPYLVRAIDVNPRSYSSFYGLGYAFYRLNQIAAALKAAQACTILNPESDQAHLLYGTLLRLGNNLVEAEKELLKAKTLGKRPNAETHWQLALLYNHLNRNKEAVAELEIYLKLAPDTPDKKKVEGLIAKLKGSK